MSVQPRRQDLCIVKDQQVIGPQQVRKFPEGPVFQHLRSAIQMQHPRRRAVRQWPAGDQLIGKVIIEIRKPAPFHCHPDHEEPYGKAPGFRQRECNAEVHLLFSPSPQLRYDIYIGAHGSGPIQRIGMKTEQQQREEIVRFGKLMHQAGLVAATDGNLSVRLENGNILCTPTLMSKGLMEPERPGDRRPAGQEVERHTGRLQRNRDASADLREAPRRRRRCACASANRNRLRRRRNGAGSRALCSELIVTLGSVPLASYETPGTPELAEALAPLVADHEAILMANHGVVTYGVDLLNAYMNMETVEHFAKIALVTHMLGNQQPISDQHVDKLREIRTKYRTQNHAMAQGKD